MRGRLYGLVACLYQAPNVSLPGLHRLRTDRDKRDERPKNASTGTGLSDVDISYDQSSRWQKFAAVPEEISSARCRENPQSAAAW